MEHEEDILKLGNFMIINPIEIIKKDGVIKIQSFIECIKIPNVTLWFELHERYEKYISTKLDCFVLHALFHAMYLGEDIEVKGGMSYKLYRRLTDYMSYFSLWYERFNVINIKCNDVNDVIRTDHRSVGSTFSGGVDGFYTLYKHLPTREDSRSAINYCFFINGLDFRLESKNNSYEILLKEYTTFLKKYEIELINVTTNFKDCVDPEAPIIKTFGTAIGSIDLLFEPLISKYYLASSNSYEEFQYEPHGSSPTTDHLLGTENLEIIYDGGEVHRTSKLAVLSEWVETYDKLRVCPNLDNGLSHQAPHLNGFEQCCHCDKCVRTMLNLKIINKLDKYKKVFPYDLDKNTIRGWRMRSYESMLFAKDILKIIEDPELKEDVEYALIESTKNVKSPNEKIIKSLEELVKLAKL